MSRLPCLSPLSLVQHGKQLVCHDLQKGASGEIMEDARRMRVRIALVNIIHGVKKVEGEAMPQPDVQHKVSSAEKVLSCCS